MNQIVVQNTPITITTINEEDYISLTDMMKAKDGDFFFHNWLRNRNTIEFLGIWEKVHNPNFNSVEFDHFRMQAGLPNFVLSVSEWLELNQIAIQQMTVLENVESKHILKA